MGPITKQFYNEIKEMGIINSISNEQSEEDRVKALVDYLKHNAEFQEFSKQLWKKIILGDF